MLRPIRRLLQTSRCPIIGHSGGDELEVYLKLIPSQYMLLRTVLRMTWFEMA